MQNLIDWSFHTDPKKSMKSPWKSDLLGCSFSMSQIPIGWLMKKDGFNSLTVTPVSQQVNDDGRWYTSHRPKALFLPKGHNIVLIMWVSWGFLKNGRYPQNARYLRGKILLKWVTVNHYSPSFNIIKHLWIPPYIGGIPTFYHPFLGCPLFRKALEAKQAGTDALQALDAVLRLRLWGTVSSDDFLAHVGPGEVGLEPN